MIKFDVHDTQPKGHLGFTLIELLISIGIVALLAALLLPAAASTIKKLNITKCANNLRQQHGAAMAFAADNSGTLPRAVDTGGVLFYRDVAPYMGYDINKRANDYPVFMCPERPLKVLANLVATKGGSIAYGGYLYNPWVCGITANGYPIKRLSQFEKPANTWMIADGNGQSAAYLIVPATIEDRIAYDHTVGGDAKAQIVMLDGHVELKTVTEMKENKGNFWAEPRKPN